MNKSNLEIAKQYYAYIVDKNINKLSSLLHEEVEFVGPMSSIKKKENVLQAIEGYAQIVQNIEIIECFTNGEKVMLTYLLTFQKMTSRAAVQLNFKNRLIEKLELYYDPTPFINFRDRIFRN
ncbi:nuclear transport factor 2 family protein [Pigmentibacter ruber]|uniref:nuclear transport factor 2 family protein n=1 Tax=Pigmentibacter ruber TaxID=2683196 RepID=UPI00131DA54A|nr:DUF4440 domain-containing protein [Pigmentibacter ruber]BFD31774.1 hypothetical protein GTC16762_13920 [Pigmentibacter ruber]